MMKRILIVLVLIIFVVSCKKKEFSPEGPTDVRIRNISDLTFEEVIVKTSEKTEDTDTLGTIPKTSYSDYFRFTKAYPKAEISAKIDIGGSSVRFSTGPVNFTYLTYIGRDRITFEVFISSMAKKELSISNVILDEALVLK